jgi:hypothetical protein
VRRRRRALSGGANCAGASRVRGNYAAGGRVRTRAAARLRETSGYEGCDDRADALAVVPRARRARVSSHVCHELPCTEGLRPGHRCCWPRARRGAVGLRGESLRETYSDTLNFLTVGSGRSRRAKRRRRSERSKGEQTDTVGRLAAGRAAATSPAARSGAVSRSSACARAYRWRRQRRRAAARGAVRQRTAARAADGARVGDHGVLAADEDGALLRRAASHRRGVARLLAGRADRAERLDHPVTLCAHERVGASAVRRESAEQAPAREEGAARGGGDGAGRRGGRRRRAAWASQRRRWMTFFEAVQVTRTILYSSSATLYEQNSGLRRRFGTPSTVLKSRRRRLFNGVGPVGRFGGFNFARFRVIRARFHCRGDQLVNDSG